MSQDRHDPLRRELDELAGKADGGLRKSRAGQAFGRALGEHAGMPLKVLAVALVLVLFGRLAGVEALRLTWVALLGAALIAYAIPVFAAGARRRWAPGTGSWTCRTA